MNYITVMATQSLLGIPVLDGYRINRDQIISMRDLPSRQVCYWDASGKIVFTSPIVEINLPGMTFYASGVSDELLARST